MKTQRLYNPLTKLVRRIKMYLSPFLMTMATIGITLAIWIETAHPERSDMVAISAIVGVLALVLAYIQVHREETDDKKRHDELLTELKGIREDLRK